MSDTQGFDPTKPAQCKDGREVTDLITFKGKLQGNMSVPHTYEWNLDGTYWNPKCPDLDLVNVASPPDAGAEAVAWQWRKIGGPWIIVLAGVSPEFHTRRGYEVRPLYAAPASALASAPRAATDDGWRHVRTGGVYDIVADARLQTATPLDLEDMDSTVVYRSRADGSVWVRSRREFHDGRFVPAPLTDISRNEPGHGAYATVRQKDDLASRKAYFDPAPAPERDGESNAAFVEFIVARNHVSGGMARLSGNEITHLVALARIGARATPAVADAGAVTDRKWLLPVNAEQADECLRAGWVHTGGGIYQEPTR